MSAPSSKEPHYYKIEITEEETKKLEKALETLSKEKDAFDFLLPVDYNGLGLPDYPKIIKRPMDLGTVKDNLLKGEYNTIREFMDDVTLIWQNCRTFNMQGSEIVKMANRLEKKFKVLLEKQFKGYQSKNVNKTKNDNSGLDNSEKTKLIEDIRNLSNEGLTNIVKIILKECPKGIEDIDNEKLQIKIDLLDHKTFELINKYMEENDGQNNLKGEKSKA